MPQARISDRVRGAGLLKLSSGAVPLRELVRGGQGSQPTPGGSL